MERVITVKGTGSVSQVPDMIEIGFDFKAKDMNYQLAIGDLNMQVIRVSNTIETLGFKKSDLKTSSFNVERTTKRVSINQYDYDYVFNGYLASQYAHLRFPFNKDRLSQVISALSKLNVTSNFNIRFYIKDGNSLKDKLLANASTDSLRKAKAITNALGVKLGKVLNISHSWSEIDIYSDTICNKRLFEEKTCIDDCKEMADIDPDDIELEDTVTITWEIVDDSMREKLDDYILENYEEIKK